MNMSVTSQKKGLGTLLDRVPISTPRRLSRGERKKGRFAKFGVAGDLELRRWRPRGVSVEGKVYPRC
jgi:hypothetical protein